MASETTDPGSPHWPTDSKPVLKASLYCLIQTDSFVCLFVVCCFIYDERPFITSETDLLMSIISVTADLRRTRSTYNTKNKKGTTYHCSLESALYHKLLYLFPISLPLHNSLSFSFGLAR